MFQNDRQKTIMELIQEKRTLKTSELSEFFNVSEMTIYRDIKPLIEQGLVIKTFGGIASVESNEKIRSPQQCVVCDRPINPRLSYRLILSNHRVESTCCVHCGFIYQQENEDRVTQALCYDFLLQTTVSASMATYVADTSIDMQCCQPQLLPFSRSEDAKKFIKGFGGRVCSFEEAMQEAVQADEACCKHDK